MNVFYPISILSVAGLLAFNSCKHDPVVKPVDPVNIDTTLHVTDTLNPKFASDILPIFIKNCSGCHNASRAEEGYVLNSYESITSKKFVAGDPDKTKIYKVLIDEDEDDRMPQAPEPPLSDGNILLIKNWILNGAPNN
jgi:hypothetical protein